MWFKWTKIDTAFLYWAYTVPQLKNGVTYNVRTLCHFLNPRSRVLFQKLRVPQILKIFPAFYKTWRFLNLFTKAHHMLLFWSRSTQSTPYYYHRSTLILSSYLRLSQPSTLLPSGFPVRIKCSNHQIIFGFAAWVKFSDVNTSWNTSLHNFFQSLATSSF